MSNKVTIYQKKGTKVKKSNELPQMVKKVDEPLEDVKIIEKYSPETINFDSKEEFIEYLAENKEKMDEMTTVKLNKTYKVDGYRITKLKGKISLRSIPKPAQVTHESSLVLQKLDEILRHLEFLSAYPILPNLPAGLSQIEETDEDEA